MRIEKWDNPNEHISTDYLFDVKGRIKEKRHNGYGDPFSYIYEYEGNSFLPFKLVYTSCWESGSVTITSLYEYTETDNKGNWTACKVAVTTETYDMDREEPEIKKDTKTYTRKIEYYTSEELKKGESYASEDTSSSGGIFAGKSFKRILLEILLVVLFLFAIGHMVYINFVRGARCGEYTIEYFQEQRKNKNLTPTSSAEENEQAWTLLNQAFLKWPVVESSDEQEYRKPKRMRHINAASAIIDQAIAFAPTDPEIVTRINELTDVINSNEERYFNGSKFLIGVAVVITLLMAYSSGETVRSIVSFGLGIAVYILASYTPAFLIEKRAKYGMGSVSNGIFAAVFSMIAGARTVRITTKWKDGREEVEDDYTQHWIAWFLGLFVIFVLGAFIIFWAILNYIRNYILYI
ncbi:MAG: hypothetical protein LIP01_10410 [Tannerellaceae bacterium]|nr:hypothetical protein [Tannerellaceae bacterium]